MTGYKYFKLWQNNCVRFGNLIMLVTGRPKKLNKNKLELVIDLYNGKKHSIAQICEMTGISKPTLYKYVREAKK